MGDYRQKFNVIIPVYNSEFFLEPLINCLINQTYTNWEALFIDDASTDSSYSILKKYSSQDKRIKVIGNEKNIGPGKTRNKGIELVVSENGEEDYIVFIDSDDKVDIRYFEALYNHIEIEKPDLIFINVEQITEKEQHIKYQKISKFKNNEKSDLISFQMTGKLPWGGVRKVVKSDLISSHNIRYSDDQIGEEAIYSFKALYYAEKISFLEHPYYQYVIRPNSQSSSFDVNPYGNIVNEMENVLVDLDIIDKYKLSLNSFALTALIVSIYRHTTYYGVKKSINYTRNQINKFKYEYGFNINYKVLEPRIRMMIPFVKMELSIILVLISKMKSTLNK